MNAGKKIKEIRIKKGLSQKELGERSGLSNVMIAQYESGTRQPKTRNLSKIAKALDTPHEFFIDYENMVVASHDEKTISVMIENDLVKKIYFNSVELNDIGKQKVIEYMDDLLENPKYTIKPAK